jgi:hypothetical protein
VSSVSADPQFMSFGSKVFDPLLWRKSAQLAESFIESGDLLILFDNTKLFCVSHAQDYNSEDI